MSRMPLALALLLLSSCGGGGDSSAPATTTHPPSNSAPTAVINVTKATGYAPFVVEFDGTSSDDSDGSISAYTWHTGDGASFAGSTITHTYNDLGTYVATLAVTDDDGASSETSITIEVHAQAAGFYFVDVSSVEFGSFGSSHFLIGSDHRIYGFISNSDIAIVYGGIVSVSEDFLYTNMLAETIDAFVFADGTQLGNVIVEAFISPRSGISGTYAGVGDSGFINLLYVDQINQPKTLADLEGNWSSTDGLGFEELMTVDGNGAFTWSDSDGCNIFGQFTPMDPALNEFDIEYDLTCPAGTNEAGDGRRKGLAMIADPPNAGIRLLQWFYTYQEGPLVGRTSGYSLWKPSPAASTIPNAEKIRVSLPNRNPGAR